MQPKIQLVAQNRSGDHLRLMYFMQQIGDGVDDIEIMRIAGPPGNENCVIVPSPWESSPLLRKPENV